MIDDLDVELYIAKLDTVELIELTVKLLRDIQIRLMQTAE